MSGERAVIRVLNVVGHTSAPLNQFALYRARYYQEEQNYIVTLYSPEKDVLDYLRAHPCANHFKLLHCHGSIQALLRQLRSLIAELRQQKAAVLLHLHHPSSAALVQLLKPFLRGIPIVYTVHNTYREYPLRQKLLASLNFYMADRVTFVSKSSYHAFPKVIKKRRERIIRVIQNGVDVERIDQVLAELKKGEGEEVEKDFSLPSWPFKLLTVGRLIEQKNQRLLLEMLAKLPEQISLTIVGQGILADELKAQARQLGIERRLQFTGLIPRDEVFRRMQTADVFVSTSFWEGLPVAVLEAMAVRMPVVLSEIDSHRELAQQGSSVELVPFDVHSWAERIASLSQLPKDQLSALGESNRKVIENHFSLKRMQANYTEVYEELWESSKGVGHGDLYAR